jgi:2-oxoglutarate/2-oxoacid ferredoxin oxidoreductase subunit alpha
MVSKLLSQLLKHIITQCFAKFLEKFMADISVVFCGEAGQGIQSIEFALMHILRKAGYCCFATKEYMSRIRGGSNSTEIRIADHQVAAFVNRIDYLFLLSEKVFAHIANRVNPNTVIIGPAFNSQLANKFFEINFNRAAQEFKSTMYANSIAIGFVLGILKIPAIQHETFFKQFYEAKSNEIAEKNILAAQAGYKAAGDFIDKLQIQLNFTPNPNLENKKLFNGSESLAFGAIAGGCNFIASYPMSPSTGVLTQLASLTKEFDILVEQAEDEIAAINMGLGAWYAGGKALVTTSGGGFALMCEGLSLAGITETPIVISLGQRPGPATGLPTRTEQGDLNLALYAGHGEFPRIIFAPGTIEEAFYLMQKSFYLADKYQIPVIILSDQYFTDSYFLSNPLDPFAHATNNQTFVETKPGYKRYQLTTNVISPRGIPGFGEGIVCVDSDEHTEEGYITEDCDVRIKMVQKRLNKYQLLEPEIIPPEFTGSKNYQTLIISWGTNYHVIKEALAILNLDNIGYLHFAQVYPLAKGISSYFTNAKTTILFENNATGQFAQLLKQQLDIKIDKKILKFDGMPFAVEEVIAAIKENLK